MHPASFAFHFPKLFPSRTRRELKELMIATTIVDFGAATIMLFEPIFLWSLGYSLESILLFWVMVYGAYLVLMPCGAKFAARYGNEPGIFVGTIFLVVYLVSLYLIQYFPHMMFVAPFIYAIHKTFYWPAFNADFAENVGRKSEGRLVSEMQIFLSIVSVLGPVIGSGIVKLFGFGWFFAVMGMVMILSNWVTLRTREKNTPKSYAYFYAFKRLFSRGRRRELIAYLGFGEELIVLGVWPIFLFVIVKDIFSTGALASIAMFVTVVLLYIVGQMTDARNKVHVMRFGVIIQAFSWIARIFVVTGFHAFLADSFGRFAKSVAYVPLMAITYDNAKNHTVIHTMMFFETALALGKVAAALLGLFILALFPDTTSGFQMLFGLAGVMTLFYALLRREQHDSS